MKISNFTLILNKNWNGDASYKISLKLDNKWRFWNLREGERGDEESSPYAIFFTSYLNFKPTFK